MFDVLISGVKKRLRYREFMYINRNTLLSREEINKGLTHVGFVLFEKKIYQIKVTNL